MGQEKLINSIEMASNKLQLYIINKYKRFQDEETLEKFALNEDKQQLTHVVEQIANMVINFSDVVRALNPSVFTQFIEGTVQKTIEKISSHYNEKNVVVI